jgi:hypothetical protein
MRYNNFSGNIVCIVQNLYQHIIININNRTVDIQKWRRKDEAAILSPTIYLYWKSCSSFKNGSHILFANDEVIVVSWIIWQWILMIGCKDVNGIELAQNGHLWCIFMMKVGFHNNKEILDLVKEYLLPENKISYKEILPASDTFICSICCFFSSMYCLRQQQFNKKYFQLFLWVIW